VQIPPVSYDDVLVMVPSLEVNDTSMIIIGGVGNDQITLTDGVAAIFGDDAHGIIFSPLSPRLKMCLITIRY
jgi:hypothetical protein